MASGYGPVTAGNPGVAADATDYWAKQAVMVYADASTRSADSTLTAALREGMVSFLADTNVLQVYSGSAWSTIGPVHGALTSWTPTVTQSGSVTVTNTYSRYIRIGRLVIAYWKLAVTGSGTSSNAIFISLPVTASATAVNIGAAHLYDSSGNLHYTAQPRVNTAADMALYASEQAQSDLRLGVFSFTAGLASGDLLSGTVAYEAAADA